MYNLTSAAFNNEKEEYFHNFFKSILNVLDCTFKLPRKPNWNGHPFYYDILKSLEKIIKHLPKSAENIISMPIWYKEPLNTKFDIDISRAGFNFIKDLFPGGQIIDVQLFRPQLLPQKQRKMRGILNNIPQNLIDIIARYSDQCTVVYPHQVINCKENYHFLQSSESDIIYRNLITNLIKQPIGVSCWREEIDLSDQQVKTAFTFARLCSSSIFLHAFQFKIVTAILPTRA